MNKMWFERLEKTIIIVLLVCFASVIGMRLRLEYSHVPLDIASYSKETEKLKVTVNGEVENPGTYTVTKGTRICDVIYAAGGVTKRADTQIVNMNAYVIADTDINIPSIYDVTSDAVMPSVNINTADADTIMLIPGIGSTTAQKIVDYRKAHGSFSDISEIINVKGIGKKKFEEIKAYIITEEINE